MILNIVIIIIIFCLSKTVINLKLFFQNTIFLLKNPDFAYHFQFAQPQTTNDFVCIY